jgi:hypothetical protein
VSFRIAQGPISSEVVMKEHSVHEREYSTSTSRGSQRYVVYFG